MLTLLLSQLNNPNTNNSTACIYFYRQVVALLIKKLFIFIFSFTVLFTVPLYSYGYCEANISAESSVVINADTEEIIFEKNGFSKKSMASTTKIMTCLLAIESGKLSDEVTVTGKIHSDGSSVGLKEGNVLTLENLVYAMMLESGNDAAEVTAEFLSGSEERFSDLMNKKAREIGMKNTNFVTASGLDDDEHYSSAYDMALLGAYAVRNPVFRRFCSTNAKTVDFVNPGYSVTFSNHNKLLKYCEGVFGIKTGFTKKSGRCLVSACKRDGVTLICVTLNAPNDWDDHEKLYDTCFSQLKTNNADCCFSENLRVYGSDKSAIRAKTTEDFYVFASLSDAKTETQTVISKILYAPIKAGDIIGETRFVYDSKVIHSVPIVAIEDAECIEGKLEKKMNFIEKIIYKYKNRKENIYDRRKSQAPEISR